MSTNNNLNATARRERALRALANTHPSYLGARKIRPGSPAARAIKVAIARHTQTVSEIHRIANAPVASLACEDCKREVMDTHACDNKPHTYCVDCCGCPEHPRNPVLHPEG